MNTHYFIMYTVCVCVFGCMESGRENGRRMAKRGENIFGSGLSD